MEVFSLPTTIHQGIRFLLKNSFIHFTDDSIPVKRSMRRSSSCPALTHSDNHSVNEVLTILAGTTAMVRNIPAKFSQSLFMKTLSERFDISCIDFLYLPVDFGTRKSLGYCFINLDSNISLNRFFRIFQGHQLSPASAKTLSITSAKVQGFERNYNLFKASSVMTLAPLEYRPMVRCPKCTALHPLSSKAASSEAVVTVCHSCS